MDEVRYIHCADLHLATPFRGLSRESGAGSRLAQALRQATFTALERLTALCEAERPDFLVVSGDLYNQEEHSILAQEKFRESCEKLAALNIPVFIVHGNHDPLSSRLSSITLPDNTTVFGPEYSRAIVRKDGVPLAVIHGISHATDRENRNLATLFKRDWEKDCFQLGVLHCAIDTPQDRYAPCSINDLINSGLDAWALGHAHERHILNEFPFIAYSGNTQGLHVNETGPKGCLLVSAKKAGQEWRCTSAFRALAPIQWEKPQLSLEGVEKEEEFENRLNQALTSLESGPEVEHIITRIRLYGATPLDGWLRQPGRLYSLMDNMSRLVAGSATVWLNDFEVATQPARNLEEMMSRDDLLGETLRQARELDADPQELAQFAARTLAPLLDQGRYRHYAPVFTEEDIIAMLADARRLCQDALEKK